MTRPFDLELAVLQSKLLEMGGLVETAIHTSVTSLVEGVTPSTEDMWSLENKINLLNIGVDEVAVRLTALHQPVARDLRFLTAAIKINVDLERMGDLAVNIAQRSASFLRGERVKPNIDLPQMSRLVEAMVRRSLDAFVHRSDEMAEAVLKADDEVDELKDAIYAELLGMTEEGRLPVRSAFDLIFVAHNLERIADHATNIAEDVLYVVKGIDVRHSHLT